MKGNLETCNYLYETQVQQVLNHRDEVPPERLLERIEGAAGFAWNAAPSLLSDPRLERLLNGIGRSLSTEVWRKNPRNQRRILHVATEVYSLGGHSRIIANWITTDDRSRHAVALTGQRAECPRWFKSALDAVSCPLSVLDSRTSRLQRAQELRTLALLGEFDLVVLHHHPDDTIPIVAFSFDGGPPVFLYNHADHVFWLGTSVADAVIDFSPVRQRVSIEDRGVRRSIHLPYVLPRASAAADRSDAKRSLNLIDRRVVLVTVGTKAKLSPTPEFDFFATLGKVLDRNPDVTLLVIGISDLDFGGVNSIRERPNLSLLGKVADLTPYGLAADIFVEPFPVGSGLACVEMCRFGAAPVFAYGKPPTVNEVLARDMFAGMASDTDLETQDEYIEEVQKLIDDVSLREGRGKRCAELIEQRSVGDGWLECVESLYAEANETTHRVEAVGEVRYRSEPRFRRRNTLATKDVRWMFWQAMASLSGARSLRDLIKIDALCVRSMIAQRSFLGTPTLLRFSARSLRMLAFGG